MVAGVKAELRYCTDCGSIHIAAPCGLTWIERVRSQTVDPSLQETRTKKKYWNSESVDTLFEDGLTPSDRKELMMEETGGVGYVDDPKSLDPKSKERFGKAVFGDE